MRPDACALLYVLRCMCSDAYARTHAPRWPGLRGCSDACISHSDNIVDLWCTDIMDCQDPAAEPPARPASVDEQAAAVMTIPVHVCRTRVFAVSVLACDGAAPLSCMPKLCHLPLVVLGAEYACMFRSRHCSLGRRPIRWRRRSKLQNCFVPCCWGARLARTWLIPCTARRHLCVFRSHVSFSHNMCLLGV